MQTPASNIFNSENFVEDSKLSFKGTLSKHCSEGNTGIIFVTTNDNKSCKIFVTEGKVEAISMRKHTGEAASLELNRVGVKAFSYSDRFNLPFTRNDTVRSSNVILNQLGVEHTLNFSS